MKQYKVEIFDRAFNLIAHTNISEVSYSVDYLSPVSNEVTVFNCTAHKNDYIRIQDGDNEFFGIIDSVVDQDAKTMTISYRDFLTIFDTDVLFDTDLQGTSTLEAVLAGLISGMFVSNADTSMNIPGLSVTTSGSTSPWGFNLKSDTAGKHHCIVNLYEVFIVRALEKYSVVFSVVPNVQTKTITLTIGKLVTGPQKIETDLPNVVEKSIIIKETDKDINKLVVYDSSDYSTKLTYYRHTDDSYDTTDSDRIVPVVQEIKAVDVEKGSSFTTAANSEAAETFGNLDYNNLIEIIVKNDDSLIKPYAMKIGQIAHIISKGNQYTSILTGKTIEDRTQLTFGAIRLDLTKIIKRRYG